MIKKILIRYIVIQYIIEIRAFIKSPTYWIKVAHDLNITRMGTLQYRRVTPTFSSNNKKVLIVTFGTVYSAKIESILAIGLKRRGWETIVLMPHRGWILKKYFQCFGFYKFIYKDEYIENSNDKNALIRIANEFISGEISFERVRGWRYKGILIGPTLLANIQRENKLATPDLSTEISKHQVAIKLPIILEWVDVSKNILEKINPDLIYLIEANDWNRPLVEQAIERDIDVIQMVQPFRDDALIFKRLNKTTFGINPNSVTKDNLLNISKKIFKKEEECRLEKEFDSRYGGRWFMQNRNQPSLRFLNKKTLISELNLDPSKKIVTIFSHILWDANLFYGIDLYKDYSEWFLETTRAAIKNPNVNWILKLHPANIWKRDFENEKGELAEITLLRESGLLPLPSHIKLLLPEVNINTMSLYKAIDYGITVRGTVGVEMPAMGIVTLTAGTGRYSNLGFTLDSDSIYEYQQKLENIQNIPAMKNEQVNLAKWHAFIVFCMRPWKFNSFKFKNGHFSNYNPLIYNIELSKENLLNCNDLQKFSNWVDDSDKNPDYLDLTSEAYIL